MDMRKIGALISTLRKEKGMTQAEFAEQLNLSHQAVSKWERGESLPDIAMLPAIGKLLGTTIDNLLAGERPVAVSSWEEARSDAAIAPEPIPASAVLESILAESYPSLPPRDGETDPGRITAAEPDFPSAATASPSAAPTLQEILKLAPFLSSSTLDLLLTEAAEAADLQAVQGLGPFASRETLERLADRTFAEGADIRGLVGLAPFLGTEQLDRLVRRAAQEGSDDQVVVSLAPFLSQDTLFDLAERAWEGNDVNVKTLQKLAPFLGRERLVQLLERAEPGSFQADVIAGLAPFMPGETLDRLVRGMLGRAPTP
ncbi:helix-turn-helix domain-containing protein [Cohnella sp. REN36]|uniref:helix-turn-helix domain-containing protein n=1 Tax=Cohnella sp. REN36 TaxID=2887347 RepID=UPI001D133BAC|nr:helix-turn-helix transcriptional regulator [Cohnella sp. REN36]MCC3376285.1 helix-turn-helix domain-containing protein [Cohnella sp. REN36]